MSQLPDPKQATWVVEHRQKRTPRRATLKMGPYSVAQIAELLKRGDIQSDWRVTAELLGDRWLTVTDLLTAYQPILDGTPVQTAEAAPFSAEDTHGLFEALQGATQGARKAAARAQGETIRLTSPSQGLSMRTLALVGALIVALLVTLWAALKPSSAPQTEPRAEITAHVVPPPAPAPLPPAVVHHTPTPRTEPTTLHDAVRSQFNPENFRPGGFRRERNEHDRGEAEPQESGQESVNDPRDRPETLPDTQQTLMDTAPAVSGDPTTGGEPVSPESIQQPDLNPEPTQQN